MNHFSLQFGELPDASGWQLLVHENASWIVSGCLQLTGDAALCKRYPHTPHTKRYSISWAVVVYCGQL